MTLTPANDPVPPRQGTLPAGDSQRRYPFAVLALIFGMLTARWIWIAGISDHGWIYEVGMRVRLGEMPYRDYICALPQLTTYTIVPLLALLNDSMWAVQIHLYLWWFASMLVGLQIIRRLGLAVGAQAAGIFLAACASFPALCLGHTYSYAGTAFFGLALLGLMRHQNGAKARDLFIAGVFGGFAVLAKQNIGVVTVLLGLATVALPAIQQRAPATFVRNATIFAAGTLIIFLPAFGYFAFHAGGREVLQQMFFDASAGKGGPARMILRTVPVLFFTEATPHRAIWMALASGGVLLFFGWFFSRNKAGTLSATAGEISTSAETRWLISSLSIVALLLTASLWNLPGLKSSLNRLRVDCFHLNQAYAGVWVFVMYAGVIALSAICLWRCTKPKQSVLLLPALALALLTCGHELSHRDYLPYAAPVALPLAVFFSERLQLVARPARLGLIGGVVTVLIQVAFPPVTFNAPTFESIRRLPDRTKFAGLCASQYYARNVEIMTADITPRIRNQPTLWFQSGGAHLAFGGRPVRSVALLHNDSYNGRSEPALFAEWEQRPPKLVFVGYYDPCANSVGFKPEALRVWLAQRYDQVYTNAELGIALWEMRNANSTQLH